MTASLRRLCHEGMAESAGSSELGDPRAGQRRNGEIHTFRNIGQDPGRRLIVKAPGTLPFSQAGDPFSQAGEPMPPGTTELPSPSGPPDVM